MPLWIGLHLPQLALEVFCPRWSESVSAAALARPQAAPLCAVLQQERVLCRSRALAQLGVQLGMRASSVRMLAPSAQIYPRDAAREERLLQACALALLQYTPQVARIGAAGLVLDIAASLRLFGGIRQLCHLVRASMQQLGVTVRLACAPNPSAAYVLACHRPVARVLQAQHLPRRLDRLPCHLLPEAQEFVAWLDGLACSQLGQLRALPRPGLQRRCGGALLQALDSVYGARQAVLTFVQAPPSFEARLELFARIEHSAALLFAAAALLQQLIGWLQVQQLAVRGIALVFEHERGRAALAPTRLEILLAEACTQQPHLLRLIEERLAKLPLPAVVIAMQLHAMHVQARPALSESLFPTMTSASRAQDFQRMLELLIARLGAENVLQARACADHRPEVANQWLVNDALPRQARAHGASAIKSPPLPLPLPRPLMLLEVPLALAVVHERPLYAGEVLQLVTSAERIEAGWFGGQFAGRDYFIAQNKQGVCYWLYRQRMSSSDLHSGWYLHGLFA